MADLPFGTFRDEQEEKTYLKHERIEYKKTLTKTLDTSKENLEDCEVKVRTELWKTAVSVFGSKDFNKEAEDDAVLSRVLEAARK